MNARTGSLLKRLTTAQVDELFPAMRAAKQGDRAEIGLELCREWNVETSRTAVHECYARHFFGWQLERAAFAAQQTGTMPEYDEEKRKLIAQKLFSEISNVDCDPKLLVLIRALELEQDKIDQRERLAVGRAKLETEKLHLAERRVKLLEETQATVKAKLEGVAKKRNGGLSKEARREIEEAAKLL